MLKQQELQFHLQPTGFHTTLDFYNNSNVMVNPNYLYNINYRKLTEVF